MKRVGSVEGNQEGQSGFIRPLEKYNLEKGQESLSGGKMMFFVFVAWLL